VSIATLLYWLVYLVLTAYIPIRMNELGASDLEIGLAVGARGVLPTLLAMSLGRIADRSGGRRLLFPSLTAMTLLGLAHGFITEPWMFVVVGTFYGISTVGVWITLQAVITHAGTGMALRTQLAFFSFMWGLGMAIGPAVGAFVYDARGFTAVTIAFAIGCAMIGITSLFIPWGQVTSQRESDTPEVPFWESVRVVSRRPAVRSVLLASFSTQYIFSIRSSFYPVVLERNGVSVTEIGLLLSIVGLTSMVIRAVLPIILRMFSSSSVLVATTLAGALAITLTPVLGSFMPALLLASVVMGIAVGINPPVTVELLARYTTRTERGLSAGMRVMVNRSAQVIQPLVFGSLAAVGGALLAWPASAAVLTGLTVAMARSLRQVNDSDPLEDDRPGTTPVPPA
jgi:MFS family permease